MSKYSTFDKIILLAGSAITLSVVGIAINSVAIQKRDIKKLEYVLDINRDWKLSEEEIKRFYDEMGISPYTTENLRNVSKKDIEKFLGKYESVDSKKR